MSPLVISIVAGMAGGVIAAMLFKRGPRGDDGLTGMPGPPGMSGPPGRDAAIPIVPTKKKARRK